MFALNASLKRSSYVFDSILEHASPRGVNVPRSLQSPRQIKISSGVKSRKLFQSISRDVAALQEDIPQDEKSADTAVLLEVKEDLNATLMAFSTLSQYMEKDVHYSEILKLKKLLDDCSLFDPLILGNRTQSTVILQYVRRANKTKEKLKIFNMQTTFNGEDSEFWKLFK